MLNCESFYREMLDKKLSKSGESLEAYRKQEKKKRYRAEGKETARRELKKQRSGQ